MITSLQNNQVKNIIKLNQKAKARREQGLFIAEGRKMFLEAPLHWIEKVYVSETVEKQDTEVMEKASRTEWEAVTDSVFRQMSDTQTPQGIMAVVRQQENSLDAIMKQPDALLLFLENIQDPGNLGTMMRTAEGAGVTGIIMSRETTDIYNPKTIRATMGSLYRMPFVYVDDFCETIRMAKAQGIRLYAAHLKGKHTYDGEDYRQPSGFLIGNEGNGLTQEAADSATDYIRIPMGGQLESLNAAVAAAVLMYEANRQRREQL